MNEGSSPRWGRWSASLVMAVGCCGALRAQTTPSDDAVQVLPNGLQVLSVQVDKAEKTSIALALPVGWSHDPAGKTGFAEVIRWWITLLQRDHAAAHRLGVSVRSDYTLVWYTGPRRFFAERLKFLLGLLDGEWMGDADLHALALGRARLQADDQAWLVPGTILRQKAWRSLGKGSPLGRQGFGIPEEIGTLTLPEIRARLGSHYGPTGAALAMVGDFSGSLMEDVTQRLRQLPRREVDRSRRTHDSAPAFEASALHERVDGPYVSAALLAPPPSDPDFAAFVLGVTMLRSQAHVRFGAQRGNEWKAEFPYVAYRYWDGARVVLVNRRGHNASSPAGPRAEIDGLLTAVSMQGFREQELVAARREVASTLAAPPFDSSSGPLLAARTRRLAMSMCVAAWPTDLLDQVQALTAERVHHVMRARLAPARLVWLELKTTPETRKFLGNRRR